MLLLAKSSKIEKTFYGYAVRMDFTLNGRPIEASLLYLPHREPNWVLCLPSQLGCSYGCHFCGLKNCESGLNLTKEQILDLISYSTYYGFNKYKKQPRQDYQVSFMGQGEPFANIRNIKKVMTLIHAENHDIIFGISTIGIPGTLKNLLTLEPALLKKIKLQISLHASNDIIRHSLMPGTRFWKVRNVIEEARRFSEATKLKVCINYMLIQGMNDSQQDLQNLMDLIDSRHFYIKLSFLNRINNDGLLPASEVSYYMFKNRLEEEGFQVKIFRSAGATVGSGCGQVGDHFIQKEEKRTTVRLTNQLVLF